MTPAPTPIQQAHEAKHQLLAQITQAVQTAEHLERLLQDARDDVVRALHEARDSRLTTPQERQQAANRSRQWRLILERRPAPPPRATTPGNTNPDHAHQPPLPYTAAAATTQGDPTQP